ncbi:hypothetical protein BH11ACT7_BH11ACT7_37800 [soil metagenome]
MAEQVWTVQIGEMSDPSNDGIPPVPTTAFKGDETGARAAWDELSSKAETQGYAYVMLRHLGDVVELWGTPPAVA